MGGLHKANINLNRKTLAHLAWHDSEAFAKLVEMTRE
jgi:ribosomal protein L20